MLPPFSGEQSHRRPLQPKNQSINAALPKPFPAKMSVLLDISNKENVHPFYSTPVKKVADVVDPSLGDELNAIREKLERLKSEEVRNEKVLRERGLMLDLEMKETVNRGEMQKQLELEVDRLYRLKEIKLACMRVSRLRSLRDKEEEKKMKMKMKQDQLNKAISVTAKHTLNLSPQFLICSCSYESCKFRIPNI